MLQCNKNQAGLTAKSFGAGRITVPVFMLALSVMAAGCESVPDVVNPVKWFEDDHPQDAAEANKDFPNLGSVPDRPVAPTLESQQAEIREGLVSDQENARYTESEVQQESARRTGNAPLSAGPRIGAAPQRVAAPTVPSAPVPAQRAVQAPSLRASVPPPPEVVRPVPAPVAPPTVRSVTAAVPPPPQIARVPVARAAATTRGRARTDRQNACTAPAICCAAGSGATDGGCRPASGAAACGTGQGGDHLFCR